jgi:hypothetical protein
MANPPGGDDNVENRKTRFVPRSDIVDGQAGKGGSANPLHEGSQADAAPAVSPSPAPAPAGAPGGTVIGRTRLVGLGPRNDAPAAMPAPAAETTAAAPKASASASPKTEFLRTDTAQVEPVVGWVVVVKGPGRGGYKPVFVGMNSVGRAPTQRISLDFGDETISREEHAFITYDDELRRYWVQNGSKSHVVRLGSETLDAPRELKGNDVLRLGKTVLRFYPVCSSEFSWTDEVGDA